MVDTGNIFLISVCCMMNIIIVKRMPSAPYSAPKHWLPHRTGWPVAWPVCRWNFHCTYAELYYAFTVILCHQWLTVDTDTIGFLLNQYYKQCRELKTENSLTSNSRSFDTWSKIKEVIRVTVTFSLEYNLL